MSKYRFTPQAVDDLFEIWSYIPETNWRPCEATGQDSTPYG
jgi:plasmid stabilization system protein ParE